VAGSAHSPALGCESSPRCARRRSRRKDIIIRKGENISAKEVEGLLYTHPKVADVAVIGVPDPELGERCCAVVVPKDGADAPTLEDIAAFLAKAGLMGQKTPEQLEIARELPRTANGKIDKRLLRERLRSGPSERR
jgi:acyl-CoA synthetase (AMP-forming)/AMP-acid ligase II